MAMSSSTYLPFFLSNLLFRWFTPIMHIMLKNHIKIFCSDIWAEMIFGWSTFKIMDYTWLHLPSKIMAGITIRRNFIERQKKQKKPTRIGWNFSIKFRSQFVNQGPVSQKVTTYRLSLRPFHRTCQNVFTISDLRLVVMTSSLCNQFTRAYHINSYIRSNQILNIKYIYFIGLCRYKSRDTLRK
jgi:hypothetical protein